MHASPIAFRSWIAAAFSLIAALSAAQESRQPGPKLGGATTVSYYRVGAAEFTPNYSGIAFTHEGGNDRLLSLDPSPVYFYANPHLPGGALLRSVEFDSCDTNLAGKHMTFFLYGCDYHGDCTQPLAVLSSSDMVADCSLVAQDLTSAAYVVDNNFKVLSVSVQFTAGNNTNKFSGVILGYQLQVSPAPPSATFTDVPTGHPFFQFVEALVNSGVTAGCGGGKFCPDNPVTRGQMAVFLAKALGMNWSQ